MRVFIGPNEVAGQYRNLAIALNANGVVCDYYVFDDDSLRYGGDIGDSKMPSLIRRLSLFRRKKSRGLRPIISLAIEVLSFIFLIKCIVRYDAFLFGYGGSFMRRNVDLLLLRLCRKRVVANLSHGSDMRPPYIDGALLCNNMRMPDLEVLLKRTREMKNRISRFERYADFVIGSPVSSSFFSKQPFINLFKIGRVSQGFRYPERASTSSFKEGVISLKKRRIRIVHAPSHAPGKGTAIIKDIVVSLIEKGYPIDFQEISGATNDDVIQALQKCDLVVDQVYADLPMSGLAAEAACFGKPTLIAGYDLTKLKSITPSICFPPTLICDPDELLPTLISLLENPERILSAGESVQRFVQNEWREDVVAERYIHLLTKETVPRDWWHDPKSAIFLHGYGLSKSMSKKTVLKMIQAYGVSGLGLEHRPDLVKSFTEYDKIPD